jgi:hypothetical protein
VKTAQAVTIRAVVIGVIVVVAAVIETECEVPPVMVMMAMVPAKISTAPLAAAG